MEKAYKFNIDEIKEQVQKIIKESQGFYDLPINIDKIIEDWLIAKDFFIEKMNGQLIYEIPELISFELDEKSKKDRLLQFADLVYTHYGNELLANFLCELNLEDFYKNKTSRKYIIKYKELEIPKDMKVVKAFKFFIPNNESMLKEIQNEASRIIQENIVSGYLCFSVHPLDFLSASENVHNWRSCHALDGEYRSGNLNYLMDSTTVICYLKAEKSAILPHFPESVPWNSKKWRVWFFFSNDMSMLFAGRQYPFANDKGINLIKDNILPFLGLGKWGPFNIAKISDIIDGKSNERFMFEKHIPVGTTLKPLKKLVFNGLYTHMYNDILSSTCYDPLYSYRESDHLWALPTGMSGPKTEFLIGKSCTCPICGKGSIDYPEIMACDNCAYKYDLQENDNYGICDICGSSVHQDDMYFLEISGSQVCPHCYMTETYICQRCHVRDLGDIISFHEKSQMYLCPNCQRIEEYKPKKIIMESKPPHITVNNIEWSQTLPPEETENYEAYIDDLFT